MANEWMKTVAQDCTLLSRKTVLEVATASAAAGTLFFCTAQYILKASSIYAAEREISSSEQGKQSTKWGLHQH